MTDDDFLRAILAAPNDDALRLVYADWLEDQGDPRSGFLRIEVVFAATGPAVTGREGLEAQLRAMSACLDPVWLRMVSRPATNSKSRIDVNDVVSIAFTFLQSLHDLCKEMGRWPSVRSLGEEIGLSYQEIKEVVQHLSSRRMLEWRSESPKRTSPGHFSDPLTRSAVISARGRAHLKAMLQRHAERKSHHSSHKGND